MKIEKKEFYSFNDDNGEGFRKLQEFSKTLKRENFISIIKDANHRAGYDKWDLLYWTDEE